MDDDASQIVPCLSHSHALVPYSGIEDGGGQERIYGDGRPVTCSAQSRAVRIWSIICFQKPIRIRTIIVTIESN